MTKIAICFFGITRSLRYTIDSIDRNILTPAKKEGNVKVYAHFFKQEKIFNPRTGEAGALDKNEYSLLPVDWLELEDPDVCLDVWKFDGLKKYGDFWNNDFNTMRNLVHQTHSLRKAALAATADGNEVCLFCRPDLIYHDSLLRPIRRAILTKTPLIQVPYWQPWTGLNDRFALCSHLAAIEAYSRRIELAHEFCLARQQPLHSERLVAHAVAVANIPVRLIASRASRVRANGMQKYEDFWPPRLAAARRQGVNYIRNIFSTF